MHEEMDQQAKKQQGFTNDSSARKPASPKVADDYIDFEEIK
jgi:hypothetical protein